jgi:hypothetical protein
MPIIAQFGACGPRVSSSVLANHGLVWLASSWASRSAGIRSPRCRWGAIFAARSRPRVCPSSWRTLGSLSATASRAARLTSPGDMPDRYSGTAAVSLPLAVAAARSRVSITER